MTPLLDENSHIVDILEYITVCLLGSQILVSNVKVDICVSNVTPSR